MCHLRARRHGRPSPAQRLPGGGSCEVLHCGRGTHALGGHLTLATTELVLPRPGCSDGSGCGGRATAPTQRVTLSVMREFASLGFPVVGGGGFSGSGSAAEAARQSLTTVANGGVGTNTADKHAGHSSKAGRRKRSTFIALIGLSLPDVSLSPHACPVRPPSTISAQRAAAQLPRRFRALIEREQGQWGKREAQIALLRRCSAGRRPVAKQDGGEAMEEKEKGEEEEEEEEEVEEVAVGTLPLPAAYVTGCALFCGSAYALGTDRAVMVPRKSTEALVRAAAHWLARAQQLPEPSPQLPVPAKGEEQSGLRTQQLRILDLGCGPGNILISLLHHCRASSQPLHPDGSTIPSNSSSTHAAHLSRRPAELLGVGLDLSEAALTLARRNAAAVLRLGLPTQPGATGGDTREEAGGVITRARNDDVAVSFASADFSQLHRLPCTFWPASLSLPSSASAPSLSPASCDTSSSGDKTQHQRVPFDLIVCNREWLTLTPDLPACWLHSCSP
jgi:methylase of polypeptide subunit release factors